MRNALHTTSPNIDDQPIDYIVIYHEHYVTLILLYLCEILIIIIKINIAGRWANNSTTKSARKRNKCSVGLQTQEQIRANWKGLIKEISISVDHLNSCNSTAMNVNKAWLPGDVSK